MPGPTGYLTRQRCSDLGDDMHQESSLLSKRRSVILAVLAGALAAGIFVGDTIGPLDVALAGLCVVVVLIGAGRLRRDGLLLVTLGCITLAVTSHILSRHSAPSAVAQA